jgi:disulfide bond formation protein DsbB
MALAGNVVERGSDYGPGAAALLLAGISILTALGYQYLGGYQPCMLCLIQRYAYYAAIPALFVALALSAGGYRGIAATLFLLVALGFLVNAGIGVYHAGAEWKFWPGPETCGGGQSLSTSAGSLLKDIEGIRVVRCDEAALRIFGLSFAGWNVIASLILAGLSGRAAFAAARLRKTA